MKRRRSRGPVVIGAGYVHRVVRARRTHTCDDHRRCRILPGELYLEAKTFPGGGDDHATAAGRPMRLRMCHRSAFFQRHIGDAR